MQEPTTTTAATSSAHCWPGSPAAAMAQRRRSSPPGTDLCPLPDPAPSNAAATLPTDARAFPTALRVAHLTARNSPAPNLPLFFPGRSPRTTSRYRALLTAPDPTPLAAREAGAQEGPFRHCRDAFPSARLGASGGAHAARSGAAEGAGRAGRDVRGRARIRLAVRAQVGASVGGALG